MMKARIEISQERDALIVVDAQLTFMPGGGLPVADGDKIIPVILQIAPLFPKKHRIATKDAHPWGHISLVSSYVSLPPLGILTPKIVLGWGDSQMIAKHAKFDIGQLKNYIQQVGIQVLWPDHGIYGTLEAELHPSLSSDMFEFVLSKGADAACDSYSAFFDNLGRPTGLADRLRQMGVKRCFFCGLAFDYCVGWSAEGAVKEGFEAIVIEDAARSVGFPPDSVQKMLDSFNKKGIRLIQSSDIVL